MYSDDSVYRISKLKTSEMSVLCFSDMKDSNRPHKEGLMTIDANCSLQEAITLMLLYDYSQLPVLKGGARNVVGAITWKSIAKKQNLNHRKNDRNNTVAQYMDKSIDIVDLDTALFSVVPKIMQNDFILVRNKEKKLCGIVSSSDLSGLLLDLSEPFLLISEIETWLRSFLMREILAQTGKDDSADFSDQDLEKKRISALVSSILRHKLKGFQQTDTEQNNIEVNEGLFQNRSLGEYIRIVENDEIYQSLGLPVDRKILCFYLDQVRLIRNKIMHFHMSGISEHELQLLRDFKKMITEFV